MKAALLKSKHCLTFLLLFMFFTLIGQESITNKQDEISSSKSRSIHLDVKQFLSKLDKAPDLFSNTKHSSEIIIELPLPDGRMKKFQMYKTQTMHPDLATKFPEIQTWHGKCLEDGISAVSITTTPAGFQAAIIDDRFERILIERDSENNQSEYISKYENIKLYQCQHSKTDLKSDRIPHFVKKEIKDIHDIDMGARSMEIQSNPAALGDKLRTHRLAVASTGEFTNANGGVAGTMGVIVGLVNQINLLYIREFAINFQIIANNDLIIYADPSTDPYVNNGDPSPDLENNNTAINNVIGSANYDIGHLMQNPTSCPGCGGWAGPGPCQNGGKASGMSVNSYSVMIHEMGHQFNCPHTTDPDFPDRYDHPAIGNTIMGGNGLGTVFHINSAIRVAAWVENPGYCLPGTNTNNTIPVVTVGTGGMSIPKSTPFVLSGSATDPDPNTTLLYTWHQYNNEMTYSVLNNRIIPAGNTPVFRCFTPSSTGNVRTIPRLEDLLSNTYPSGLFDQNNMGGDDTLNWETLPSYSRSLTFRLVARDYEMTGGAFDYDELTFSVDGNSGPFVVTSPNTGNPTWTTGSMVTVTWNVANTNIAPVSCVNVNLKLSVDGGFTYPYTLAANTPNDGTQTFTLPEGIPGSTQARVRVECATYTNVVFFDISNQNFTISSACDARAGIIVPATTLTAAQGSPSLDLTLTPLYGVTNSPINFSVVPANPVGKFALWNTSNTCQAGCCDLKYSKQQFQVDKPVNYTFDVFFAGGFYPGFFTIYSGSYMPNSTCTNFVTSNSNVDDMGGVGKVNPVTVTLTPGITYEMVFHPWFMDNASGTVGISSPDGGTIVMINQGQPMPPVTDYAYTYVAVNQATGLITAHSQQADFTSLSPGTYHIFGMSYKSANAPPAIVNPNNILNMSMSSVFSSFPCLSFSSNFKKVVVEGTATPNISIAATDANKVEGNSGMTAFTFTVTRTGNTASQSTAAWAVSGSGANPANGTDFSGGNFPTGSVTFPAGSSATQTININVNSDLDVEQNEGFAVTLSNPVNGTITTASANGTIQNDDTSIAISGTPSLNEGNTGTTAFTFTVSRTGNTTNQSTASWAVSGSGANPSNSADFSGSNFPTGTVTFPAGSSATQTITVNVNGDLDIEPNEGFTVTLSNPVNGTITTATTSGTILNDDVAAAYCVAGATNISDEKISSVQFNTINNASASTAGYEDFTALSTTVQQGSTYVFTGIISTPYSSDQIIVWLDNNQDLDFNDSGEQVFISPTGVGPHSGNITIPAGAMTGNTRMRIRLHDTANGPNATPCGNSTYGQIEDYTINIIPSVPMVVNVSASPDYVCNGGNTILNVTAGEVVATPSGGSITINDFGNANPYPGNIVVSGVPGVINNLKVTITNLSHTYPADMDMVLFGPTGAHSIIFTNAIGDYPGINGITYTFQTGSTPLPLFGFPDSGTYDVVNGNSYSGSGTPSAVTNTGLGVFNGTNPNGTWSLYVFDDAQGDFGSIGSWSLEITTNNGVQATEYSWSPTTFLNNPKIESPSASGVTSATTYTVTVSTSLPVSFDGVITEAAWGTALATSAGGPSPGFGAGHEINALYIQGNLNDINLAIAGNVTYSGSPNEILVFIDSKAGGYPGGNFGRANAPGGVINFNSGTTFDSGFVPDYCLAIKPNSANNNYFFDLYTLSGTAIPNSGGGPNNYLGDTAHPKIGASPLNSDNTRGFEVAIPKSAIGYTGGPLKVMAMYIADNGLLSNQFLTKAGSGQGNFGNGSVNFGTELPDPITVPNLNLSNYGTSTGMVTVRVEGLLVKNTGNSGFNSLRSVYNCYSEGTGLITYDQQGMPPTSTTLLTGSLHITKSVTIQGLSNIARPEITIPVAGINIATGKTITLQNVDLKSNGTATFTGNGTLKITGTTVGKQ